MWSYGTDLVEGLEVVDLREVEVVEVERLERHQRLRLYVGRGRRVARADRARLLARESWKHGGGGWWWVRVLRGAAASQRPSSSWRGGKASLPHAAQRHR